jgi:hypothetical protein
VAAETKFWVYSTPVSATRYKPRWSVTFGTRRIFVLLWDMSISGSCAVAVPTISWCSRNILLHLDLQGTSAEPPGLHVKEKPRRLTKFQLSSLFAMTHCWQHRFLSAPRSVWGVDAAVTKEAIYALNHLLRTPRLYVAYKYLFSLFLWSKSCNANAGSDASPQNNIYSM